MNMEFPFLGLFVRALAIGRVRRRVAIVASLICALGVFPAHAADAIKILTIGSSFAENATKYLPELAASRHVTIIVRKANLGGSGVAQHAAPLLIWEKDPTDPRGRSYRDREHPERPNFSLVEALESEAWNYVTIQQFSGDSFKPETYEPHWGQLVQAVKKHAPQAIVLVHETWAYREDHEFFADGKLNQQGMYDGLVRAYNDIAHRYHSVLVPVGDAFQIARATPQWHFTFPDPGFDYANPPEGKLPNQMGSLNVGWFWKIDAASGKKTLTLDAKHANVAGCYLGACVFFACVTGQEIRDVTWKPAELSEARAASLRLAASEAVRKRR
jgi:hypothetical protein